MVWVFFFLSAGCMLSLLGCFLRLHIAGVAFMRRLVCAHSSAEQTLFYCFTILLFISPSHRFKTLLWEARELCVELCQRYFVMPHDCRLFIGLGLVVHSKGGSDVSGNSKSFKSPNLCFAGEL